MKTLRNILIFVSVLFSHTVYALSANDVLDKTAVAISESDGVTATFAISGKGQSTVDGNVSVKGKMFKTTMPYGIVWFDGKTQWTYVSKNEEVNVNTPSESELQSINPYNFIYIYRNGYESIVDSKGDKHIIHLTATDNQHSIKQMEITVDKTTYIPSKIRMNQNGEWYTILIKSFKKTKLSDNMFRFNPKDYPQVEIIDLR